MDQMKQKAFLLRLCGEKWLNGMRGDLSLDGRR
jgi:hypothetical protein